jgi:hypothetical protein
MEQYKRVHTRFAGGYRNEVAHDLLPAGTSVSTSAERLHAGLKSRFESTEEVGSTKARTGRCLAGTRVSLSVERLRGPAGLKSLFESAECRSEPPRQRRACRDRKEYHEHRNIRGVFRVC